MIQNKLFRAVFCAVLCVLLTGCTQKPQSSDSDSDAAETAVAVMDAEDAKLILLEREVLPENNYDTVTIVMDSVLADAGEQNVPIRVMVFNNPGYVNYGIRLLYAEKLKPVCIENTDEPRGEAGEASEDMMTAARVDSAKQMIGFVAAGAEENTVDGILYTLYFDVPENAKSNTVYPLHLDVQDFKNSDGEQLMPTVVQGGIQIQ